MTDAPYSKRELDEKFNHILAELSEIKIQTTKHNGRMSKVERNILIIACVTGTILMTKGSELTHVVKLFL